MSDPVKMFYFTDIPMELFPASERWLVRNHSTETLQWIGPYIHDYYSYLAVPPTDEARGILPEYGTYNWRMTGHVYTQMPPPPEKTWLMTSATPHPRNLADSVETLYGKKDYSKFNGKFRQPIYCFTPYIPDDDYKGRGFSIFEAKQVIRWVTIWRFPEYAEKEWEQWFSEELVPAIVKDERLLRFFSYKCLQPEGYRDNGCRCVCEMWFTGYAQWIEFVNACAFIPAPSFSRAGKFPFLVPYEDFFGMFILERPTNDWLNDSRAYYARP